MRWRKGSGPLQRLASYGLSVDSEAAGWFALGEGLVGQARWSASGAADCAAAGLPVDFLGTVLRYRRRLGPGAMLARCDRGVFEFASFRAMTASEAALLEELLPGAGDVAQHPAAQPALVEQQVALEQAKRRPRKRPA